MKCLLRTFILCVSFLCSAPLFALEENATDEQIYRINDKVEQFVLRKQYTEATQYCNKELSLMQDQIVHRFLAMQKARIFIKRRDFLDSIPLLYNKYKSGLNTNDSIQTFIYARFLETVGHGAYLTSQPDKSIKFLSKADSIYEHYSFHLYRVYNLKALGNIYQAQSNYSNALLTLYSAKECLIKNLPNDSNLYINVVIDLSLAYYHLQIYDKAISLYHSLLSYRLNDNQKSKIFNNLGIIYSEQGNYKLALKQLRKAKVLFTKTQDVRYLSRLYNNLATAMQELAFPEDSILFYFQKSIAFKHKMHDYVGLVNSNLNLSEFYLKHDKVDLFTNTMDTLEKWEDYFTAQDFTNFHLLKYMYFNEFENYEDALLNYRLYHAYNDTVLQQASSWKLTRAENAIEVQQKQNTIDLLEKEQTITDIKQSKQEILLWSIASVGFVVILVLVLVANYYYNRQRYEKQLRSREVNLASVRSLVRGQEAERMRLARDLHDEIGSNLAIIKAEVIKSIPPSQSTYLSELVSKTAEDVRNITHNLMPASISRFGLKDSLKELSKQWKHTAQLLLDVNFHPENIELQKDESLTLFRIVQELIKNSVTHGKADYVLINILDEDNMLKMIYEDNGTGFKESNEPKSGIGMKNIKNRVAYLNGNMNIESSEKGLKINFTFVKQTT